VDIQFSWITVVAYVVLLSGVDMCAI